MHARVRARHRLTPSLVRVVLDGGNLADLAMPDATDAYVNVAIPPRDAPYDAVFDPAEVREGFPRRTPGRPAAATRCGPGTRRRRC